MYHFIHSKKTYSTQEYLSHHDRPEEIELYEEVECVHIYPDDSEIFQIKENESWEYNSFKKTDGPFSWFIKEEQVIEAGDLDTLEKIIYAQYICELIMAHQ